jgi:hemerythrin superfamily protein
MAQDAISLLLDQHQQIKTLFEEVEQGTGTSKRDAWQRLVHLLAVHETAEEEVIRPTTRSAVEGGDAIANARIAEEDEAKRMLADLEKLGPEGEGFDAQLRAFRQAVVDHAELEEREEFPRIRAAKSASQLETLGKALEAAEATAPTHPHPNAPNTATGNLVAGPFAAVVDRTRDAIRNALQSG